MMAGKWILPWCFHPAGINDTARPALPQTLSVSDSMILGGPFHLRIFWNSLTQGVLALGASSSRQQGLKRGLKVLEIKNMEPPTRYLGFRKRSCY